VIVAWRVFVFPYNKWHKTISCPIKRIATNTHAVTAVVFLNLPPIVNALGVLRITLCVSLKNLVSIILRLCIIFYSIRLNIFIFFQEQGRRNDLFSKGVSPVPQDLMSTPGISKNINSDSVHCDPLSCMASGSRCHTADYLKEMKVVDSSVPCLSSSLLKSPTVSTNIKSDSVHCDPLSCVASGSRCHTADYLNVTKGVDASIPCFMCNDVEHSICTSLL
jgi:hypothetical protein